MKRTIEFVVLALLCVACTGAKRGKEEQQTRKFPKVTVPTIVENPQTWMALHFWDKFADTTSAVCFRDDSLYVAGVAREEFEQQFSNFTALISGGIPRPYALEAARNFYRRTSRFAGAWDVAQRYLYDSNSPVRDEDLYGAMLSLKDPSSPTVALCALNPVGEKATDFEYYDKRGRTRTLFSTKGEYTILVFGNLECHACKEIKEAFDSSELLQSLLASGKVALVDIPVDDDLSMWDGLYHIRAIPSVYLLSEDKTVILKDCDTNRLLYCLQSIYSR